MALGRSSKSSWQPLYCMPTLTSMSIVWVYQWADAFLLMFFCVDVWAGTWMWRLHVNVKCLSQFLSTVHFMAGFLKNLELTDWLASKLREFPGLQRSEVGITGACHSASFALIFFLNAGFRDLNPGPRACTVSRETLLSL